MAESRLTVLVALADRRRAEELAAHLGDSEAMLALLADEAEGVEAATHFDAVVTDDARRSVELPTVLIADGVDGARRPATVRATLRRSAADSLIAAAVRLAVAGYAVAPEIERPNGVARDSGELLPAVSLTQREKEVIALLAEGASNKLIARRLDISVHTAKFHVAAILEKLGAVNRTDAIAIAMREGLVLV
jgi:DNA-binding CsgD family transcriptional regulator